MDPSSYTYQSPKTPSGGRRSHASPRSQRQPTTLGVISEDTATILPDSPSHPPPLPTRAHNRPLTRMFHLGIPPRYGAHGDKAPGYNDPYYRYDDVKGPKGEAFGDLRQSLGRKRWARGGWGRLICCGIAIIVVLVIALGLGLGLGLRAANAKKENQKANPSSNSQDSNAPPLPFPLGSYAFTTFLASTASTCVPQTSMWSCFPYVTYNDSTTGSMATFNWIISSTTPASSLDPDLSNNPTGYLISSSNNPWALTFSNATLRYIDAPSDSDKALVFSVPMSKTVIPNTDITGDGSAVKCLFENTRFEAKLYTKRPRTYPANTENEEQGNADTADFKPWQFAAEVSQTTDSDMKMPNCYRTKDGGLGEKVEVKGDAEVDGTQCKCDYRSFGD